MITSIQVFLKNKLTNLLEFGECIALEVNIGYQTDLQKAIKVAKKAILEMSLTKAKKEPQVFFVAFRDSTINCILCFWIQSYAEADIQKAQQEGIKQIQAAFEQYDIELPFPIKVFSFKSTGTISTNNIKLIHSL